MNRLPQLALALLLVFAAPSEASAQAASDTIPYAPEHHAERLAEFAKEPMAKGRIIFLGNSITEFGDWKALLGDSTVVNRGIAGDITYGILRRLEEVVRREPSKLFLEAGINDIAKNVSPATIARRISVIVATVRRGSPRRPVYVISVLPTNDAVKNEYPDVFNKNDRVEAVNVLLRANAVREQYIYVDLHRELRDAKGKLDVRYAESDGLHLNAEGYRVWIKLLRSRGYVP
jgi:lysophospholipase L1-like esterase